MKTVNVTIKIEENEIPSFESWLNQHLEIVSLKILPETEKLYEKDLHFQKLVKDVKKAQRNRDNYINKYNE